MMSDFEKTYEHVRSGGTGFYQQKRGLIAVWGKEAVQFLDGMITNDMKTLEDGAQMLAAFPNAQGRLLAVVRVLRQGDRFLFETEEVTHEKVFNNLFRFTFAGDFFVEDLSDHFCFLTIWGDGLSLANYRRPEIDRTGQVEYRGFGIDVLSTSIGTAVDVLVPATQLQEDLLEDLVNESNAIVVSDDIYEVLRIESGVPKYGVDMDETTIVPELGIDTVISYTKGCYIGQEIIARIHFRGHVAKKLTGLALSVPPATGSGNLVGQELKSQDGKNAGRITSVTFSPKLDKTIALAYVRYDYLAEGTELIAGETTLVVTNLPFIK